MLKSYWKLMTTDIREKTHLNLQPSLHSTLSASVQRWWALSPSQHVAVAQQGLGGFGFRDGLGASQEMQVFWFRCIPNMSVNLVVVRWWSAILYLDVGALKTLKKSDESAKATSRPFKRISRASKLCSLKPAGKERPRGYQAKLKSALRFLAFDFWLSKASRRHVKQNILRRHPTVKRNNLWQDVTGNAA